MCNVWQKNPQNIPRHPELTIPIIKHGAGGIKLGDFLNADSEAALV